MATTDLHQLENVALIDVRTGKPTIYFLRYMIDLWNRTGGVNSIVTDLTDLTASTTELNYTDGVTSNIQTQLNSRLTAGNNLSDVGNTTIARANLGLGTAATTSSANYLQVINDLSDLSSAATARSNLGLGTAALSATGDFQAAIGASTAYAPTITGFSVNPTISATYYQLGKLIIYTVYSSAVGTSNATTFTLSAPVASANNGIRSYAVGTGQDNSAATAITAEILPNTSTVNLFKGPAATAFTNVNNKSASFTLIYEAA